MDLEEIFLEVTALLGKATLPKVAYQELRVGDILVLDQTIDAPLVTRVGTQERFLVTAGLFEIHKAVLIDERINS